MTYAGHSDCAEYVEIRTTQTNNPTTGLRFSNSANYADSRPYGLCPFLLEPKNRKQMKSRFFIRCDVFSAWWVRSTSRIVQVGVLRGTSILDCSPPKIVDFILNWISSSWFLQYARSVPRTLSSVSFLCAYTWESMLPSKCAWLALWTVFEGFLDTFWNWCLLFAWDSFPHVGQRVQDETFYPNEILSICCIYFMMFMYLGLWWLGWSLADQR